MRDNCVIFATPERQELRVVFDPDRNPVLLRAGPRGNRGL